MTPTYDGLDRSHPPRLPADSRARGALAAGLFAALLSLTIACGGSEGGSEPDAAPDVDAQAACAQTCDGCCDGEGNCLEGESDSACGTGGESCRACSADQSCEDKACVAASCADTCDGCCDGEECLGGDESAACGASGDSCIACDEGLACVDGACVADPETVWRIEALAGTVADTKEDGSNWDVTGFADPDPYVAIRAGGDAENPEIDVRTDEREETFEPEWNQLLTEEVTSEQLDAHFEVGIFDDDPPGNSDDPICDFAAVDPFDTDDNGVTVVTCDLGTAQIQITQVE